MRSRNCAGNTSARVARGRSRVICVFLICGDCGELRGLVSTPFPLQKHFFRRCQLVYPIAGTSQRDGRMVPTCLLCCQRCARHCLPSVKSLNHGLAVFSGGEAVAAWTEVRRDGTI